MTVTINATYENGLLRPDEPVPLREHSRVKLTISPLQEKQPSAGDDPFDAVIGSCTHGPDASLAETHDVYLYRLKEGAE